MSAMKKGQTLNRPPRKQTGIRIPEDQHVRLLRIADYQRTSISSVIFQCVDEFLPTIEREFGIVPPEDPPAPPGYGPPRESYGPVNAQAAEAARLARFYSRQARMATERVQAPPVRNRRLRNPKSPLTPRGPQYRCAAKSPHNGIVGVVGSSPTGTQASNVGRLSALFAFAVRRGWMPRNPCERLEHITIERTPPKILGADLAGRMLRGALTQVRAWVVLGLFCGLRPSEAARMDWGSIKLSEHRLVVDASASKVRRRRIVALQPAAAAWLALDARETGPVVSSIATLRRYRRKLSEGLGLTWTQDVLRHTYASMRLAAGATPSEVATEMGTSERMLGNHYREIVQREEAETFWSVRPE